jgi:hypothetical protein
MSIIVTTKEPLSLVAIYQISKNKPIKLGDYKCRIMNFSANQKLEAVAVVEYMGHKWGIKPLDETKNGYNALAFVVKE